MRRFGVQFVHLRSEGESDRVGKCRNLGIIRKRIRKVYFWSFQKGPVHDRCCDGISAEGALKSGVCAQRNLWPVAELKYWRGGGTVLGLSLYYIRFRHEVRDPHPLQICQSCLSAGQRGRIRHPGSGDDPGS